MSGVEIVQAVIEILVSGLTKLATGIGQGVSSLAKSLFFETVTSGDGSKEQLSVFGTLIIVFAGISLAIGLSRLIFHWLTSLGAKN